MTYGTTYEKDGKIVIDETALTEAARTYGDRMRALIAVDEAKAAEVEEKKPEQTPKVPAHA